MIGDQDLKVTYEAQIVEVGCHGRDDDRADVTLTSESFLEDLKLDVSLNTAREFGAALYQRVKITIEVLPEEEESK